jgi:RNA polymerase sigma factor (sigma-70 family)
MTISEFNQVYVTYYRYAVNFAAMRVSKEEAEDIVDGVFTYIFERLDNSRLATIKKYLFDSVKTKCIDLNRRKKFHKRYELYISAFIENEPPSLHKTEALQLNQAIISVLDQLPTQMKKAIRLQYLEQYSRQEVAEQLGISANTVRNTTTAGLHKLRTEIKNRGISAHG